jgi:hypothetical protein
MNKISVQHISRFKRLTGEQSHHRNTHTWMTGRRNTRNTVLHNKQLHDRYQPTTHCWPLHLSQVTEEKRTTDCQARHVSRPPMSMSVEQGLVNEWQIIIIQIIPVLLLTTKLKHINLFTVYLMILSGKNTYHRKGWLSIWTGKYVECRGLILNTILCYTPKVAGSIPDEGIGFFNWPNPSTALWPWGRLSL